MPRTKKSIKKSITRKPKRSSKKRVEVAVAKENSTSFPVLSVKGEKTGSISVPKDLFGAPYNTQLVSQAIRVFRTNQREGSAGTKTRGMVEGSTRKIYRQKGTGRARHGGIRAPIFVGGGIVFGPQPKDIHKTLPKKMKKKALASALSWAAANNKIKIIDGLSDLPVKTKEFDQMFHAIQVSKRILFICGTETKSVVRAVRNIENVSVLPFDTLNTFDVMTHAYIVFAKDALVSLAAKYTGKIL